MISRSAPRRPDYFGTPQPQGYVNDLLPKTLDYNGGTVIDDVWYQGVIHPLPKLATGFEFVSVCSWGWHIVKK